MNALTTIETAISDLLNNFEKFTIIEKDYRLPDDYKNIYRDSLFNLAETLSSSNLLLSDELSERCQYFVFIFSAFNQKNISKCREFRKFAYQVAMWLKYHLAKELKLGPSHYPSSIYKFRGVSHQLASEIDKIGVEKFFEDEYSKWKVWSKKQ